jgi:FtsP/CotA-like multicopper oxidase with cupredoxin domain
MHPEVTSEKPDRCPKCGMKLVPANLVEAEGGHGHEHHHGHGHHGHSHEHEGHGRHGHGLDGAAKEEQQAGHGRHAHGDGHHGKHHGAHHPDDKPEHPHDAAQGIEWEDDMVEVNRMTTPANMRWKLVDRETGAENAQIDWTFHVGDQVKLRLVNELDSDHPMPHPFHVHGAGRFVVLARDDVVEPNLVWKNTVLVRTGETVDILLEVTNPGRWMAHCHIAEHHESGMMFSFDAVP